MMLVFVAPPRALQGPRLFLDARQMTFGSYSLEASLMVRSFTSRRPLNAQEPEGHEVSFNVCQCVYGVMDDEEQTYIRSGEPPSGPSRVRSRWRCYMLVVATRICLRVFLSSTIIMPSSKCRHAYKVMCGPIDLCLGISVMLAGPQVPAEDSSR